MRLDVGCGWGGMVRAATHHGVRATGVTLSRAQAEWADTAVAEAGLRAWVRNLEASWDEAVAEVGPGRARVATASISRSVGVGR